MSRLANLLCQSWKKNPAANPVNIVDLCTGTGCIPLLFHHELFNNDGKDENANIARIVGVDISRKALLLAEENRAIQIREQETARNTASQNLATLRDIQFIEADLLAGEEDPASLSNALFQVEGRGLPMLKYEIVISNPPYISSSAFRRTTAASVRKFEPRLALVPQTKEQKSPTPTSFLPTESNSPDDGDIFYPKLLDTCDMLGTKVVLFEVADMEQACRVAAMALERWRTVEIWRDDPGANAGQDEVVHVGCEGEHEIRVYGQGNGRSVVAYRGEGCQWMGN